MHVYITGCSCSACTALNSIMKRLLSFHDTSRAKTITDMAAMHYMKIHCSLQGEYTMYYMYIFLINVQVYMYKYVHVHVYMYLLFKSQNTQSYMYMYMYIHCTLPIYNVPHALPDTCRYTCTHTVHVNVVVYACACTV